MKFGKLTFIYITNKINKDLGYQWTVSYTSKGNIRFYKPGADEYFTISLYKDKYYIRRYANYLDRCYLICPSHYEKYVSSWGSNEKCKYFDYENYNDALNAFIKFIEKNRS